MRLVLFPVAGEYISPEYIESVLKTASAVEAIWVTGRSDMNAVVAVIVPNPEAPEVARACGGDLETFCQSQEANDLIMEQLAAASRAARLKVCPQQLSSSNSADMQHVWLQSLVKSIPHFQMFNAWQRS